MHVVLTANDNYALGAAVTLQSCIDTFAGTSLSVHILDTGLSEHNRLGLLSICAHPKVKVTIKTIDTHPLAHLPLSREMQTSVYAYFLLPDLLLDIERVVVLDADLLVLHDIQSLASVDLYGCPLAACQDVSCPTVNTPHLGLNNYARLGIAPEAPYFNSGVLILDLVKWRECRYAQKCIEMAEKESDAIQWWDQDVLNMIFANNWLKLDPCWNDMSEGQRSLGSHCALLEGVPSIIHFVGRYKPWKSNCKHSWVQEWLQVLSRTPLFKEGE